MALLAAAPAYALEPGLPQRTHSLGGTLRLGILRGEPTRLKRDGGFGFGVKFRWFYRLGLALAVQADYDRFGSPNDPEDQLSRTSFTVMQAAAWPLAELLPWVAFGGGIGVGVFRTNDDETEPMDVTDTVPIVRVGAGIGYEIHRRATIGISAGYDWVFTGDSVSTLDNGRRRNLTVFDDTVHIAAGADYYF